MAVGEDKGGKSSGRNNFCPFLWSTGGLPPEKRHMRTAASNLIVCAKCKRTFNTVTVRQCPHEAVNRTYGTHICYFCCKHCRYHTKVPLCGAIGCGYKHDSRN